MSDMTQAVRPNWRHKGKMKCKSEVEIKAFQVTWIFRFCTIGHTHRCGYTIKVNDETCTFQTWKELNNVNRQHSAVSHWSLCTDR